MTIPELIAAGALFVINSSAGKDSQAMTIHLHSIIPAKQLLIVHADLGEVEWKGVQEHIHNTSFGLPVHVVKAGKTFFDMVEHRGMFPSPQYRQCTSDLKRAPIETFLRRYMKQHGLTYLVNCMGIRAKESPARAKKTAFKRNDKNSKAGREWYDWLPIFDLETEQVFSTIEQAGQKPHWAYGKGMSRLSCVFCIMASKRDHQIAATERPELLEKIDQTENRLGKTMMNVKDDNGNYLTLKQYIASDAH